MENLPGPPTLQQDELRQALLQHIRHPYITNQGIAVPATSIPAEDKVSSAPSTEKVEKESIPPVGSG